jgi:lycopene beta-cyclase
MTYWKFHLIFNLPLLILGAWLAGFTFWSGAVLAAAGLVLLAVMIFTTPWDNYAVAQGIWGFPRERFTLKLWHLPIEEYAFFIIESIQVMFLTFWLLTFFPETHSWPRLSLGHPLILGSLAGTVVIWMAVGYWGRRRFHAASSGHYAWHLFFWFLPVIVLQWVIAAEAIFPRWPIIAVVTGLVGSYLSVADYIAIDKGIWHFDEKQITGYKLGNKMPWEEAAFFYLTAFLVAQSFVMLLPEALR